MPALIVRLLPYGVAIALALGSLYGAYRHGVTTERARSDLAIQSAMSESARLIIAEQRQSAKGAAELDARFTGELNNAYQRIEELDRPHPNAKPVRVYVKAKCPAAGSVAMPKAGAATSLGDRSQQGAELDGESRADYFELLRAIALKETALSACVAASQSR